MTINVHDVKKGTSVKLSPDRTTYVVEKIGVTYNTITGRKTIRKPKPVTRVKCPETHVFRLMVSQRLEHLGHDLPTGISVSTKKIKGLLCLFFNVSSMVGTKAKPKQIYIGTKNTWEKRLEKAYRDACEERQSYYALKHNNLQQKLASRQ